jgi:zinc protease
MFKNITIKSKLLIIFFFIALFANFLKAEEPNLNLSFKLKNGLSVILVKTKSPIVSQIMAYDVGSIEEPSGKEGLAHLVEHAMFLGSKNYTKEQFSKTIQSIGGEYNAFTNFDKTSYYLTAPKIYLEELIKLESDRMAKVVLNADLIKNEIEVVLEERNKLYNNQYIPLYFDIYSKTYTNTNYGRSIIGYVDTFRKINKDDVENFYKAWYYPANAKLVIIGNIDLDKTKRLVEKYYGGISSMYFKPKRANLDQEPLISDTTIKYNHPNIKQDVFIKVFLVPSYNTDLSENKITSRSLVLLASILQNNSARFYKKLVDELKIATNVELNYDFENKGFALFTFEITPKDGVSLDDLETKFNKVLSEFINQPATQAELNYANKAKVASLEFLKEDELKYAVFLADYALLGLSYEDTFKLHNSFNNITLQNLNDVFKTITTQKSVVGKAYKK